MQPACNTFCTELAVHAAMHLPAVCIEYLPDHCVHMDAYNTSFHEAYISAWPVFDEVICKVHACPEDICTDPSAHIGLQIMLARACVTFAPTFASQYYSTCAIGFSAVLFAMKVVLNSNSPGWSSVAGISLPTKVLLSSLPYDNCCMMP